MKIPGAPNGDRVDPGAPGLCVAIATLNRPEGLERCLGNLVSGECLPSEIVVVDQGASGATRQVLERFRTFGIPVIHVVQQRLGLSASRNAAVEKSHFDIVAFTDDDCAPDPGWTAALARAFADPSVSGVSGPVLPLGTPGPGLHAVSSRTSTRRKTFEGPQAPWPIGTGGNLAVRRKWLDRVGPFDERLGVGTAGRAAEDMDMIYRLLRVGASFLYAPDAVIYHELQTTERLTSSRFNYGYGMGAFFGAWLMRGDFRVIGMLARWSSERLRALRRARKSGDREAVAHLKLMIRGLLAGLAYGPRIRSVPKSGGAESNPVRRG